MNTKTWTLRALIHFIQAESSISSSSTEQQQYDFTLGESHVVRRLYTASDREGESFYLWTLQLQVKGITSFAEIHRVKYVQCHSFRNALKVRGLLTNDTEWTFVLSDAFR